MVNNVKWAENNKEKFKKKTAGAVQTEQQVLLIVWGIIRGGKQTNMNLPYALMTIPTR